MADALLRRKLDRQRRQIEALERLIEDRSRLLYAAQAELQTGNRFLVGVFAALRCAVIVVDPAGTIAWANDAVVDLVGVAPDQLVGTAFSRLLPAACAGWTAESLGEREQQLLRRSGARVSVHLSAAPLLDDHGERVGTVCSAYELRAERAATAVAGACLTDRWSASTGST